MFRLRFGLVRACTILFLLISLFSALVVAQVETATVSGLVVDSSGLRVVGARIELVDIDRGTSATAPTDNSGVYRFPSVHPGRYRMQVRAPGFRVIDVTSVIVNVQDHLEQNFKLTVGSVLESVTVDAGGPTIDTESPAVSSVIDRQFADNLPMNGRSFQTLIELSPGVTLTPSSASDGGQFSINGQRASSNYWTIDGVSANIGAGASAGQSNGLAGALPGFSVQGGTNSLVSVDALQEFRIQTSTYAPEFGRTPGGQISIVTRSGTNKLSGTLFDYFRNDVLDANDWFADAHRLPKPRERQNDFGGTVSGPIQKDRTFFFFSYEGLRLRLPQVVQTVVPDLTARRNATVATQSLLSAFPIPNGAELGNGTAQFNSSFSNGSTLDAASLRVDHKVSDRLAVFGRSNYSPSQLQARQTGAFSPSSVTNSQITTMTTTAGFTWTPYSSLSNDFRFNYSRNRTSARNSLDTFGGAVPLASSALQFPNGFTLQNSSFEALIFSGTGLTDGKTAEFLQKQFNFVDNISVQTGPHSLKIGVDYRTLMPDYSPLAYEQTAAFSDVPSAEAGSLAFAFVSSSRDVKMSLRNLGLFAQDAWRVTRRLTLTYGLRWDVDFAPASDPKFAAATNFGNISQLALAPYRTPLFETTYRNVAPRVGVAYKLRDKGQWETALRAGFGVFYDLVTSELGSVLNSANYPFGAANSYFGVPPPSCPNSTLTFPLDACLASPLPIAAEQLKSSGAVFSAFNPNVKLPYTLEWNVALQQSLGPDQSVSLSYVGAAGRRLLQTEFVSNINPNFYSANLVSNYGTSDYDALQVHFDRRLVRGLQVVGSYTFGHSIDTGSASSAFGNQANIYSRQLGANSNRGPSDFDIRNEVSAGVTYAIPTPRTTSLLNVFLGGWSVENILQARSASPLNASVAGLFFGADQYVPVRPDLVPDRPVYLYGLRCLAADGPLCPGGKGLNPAAFTSPPIDPNSGFALRQGDLGRNALRGFGALQWDLAVHRDFAISESVKLQFRAEMFNVINHPNFGNPQAIINSLPFGVATQMLGQSLSPNGAGAGAFSPLYQIGGPRSIQLATKLTF